MATRQLLAELVADYKKSVNADIAIESIGGVNAAKRVQAGEAFDAVFLSSEAIDELIAAGHIDPTSKVNLVNSGVAVAVKAGAQEIHNRIVQAPSGVPVGSLIAKGEVELGFQQLSELIHLEGIRIVGPLPPEIQITTTFSAGVCTASTQKVEAGKLLSFMASPAAAAAKLRQGMEVI